MWGLSHYDCALGTAFLTLWYTEKDRGERGEGMNKKKGKKKAVSFVLNI